MNIRTNVTVLKFASTQFRNFCSFKVFGAIQQILLLHVPCRERLFHCTIGYHAVKPTSQKKCALPLSHTSKLRMYITNTPITFAIRSCVGEEQKALKHNIFFSI